MRNILVIIITLFLIGCKSDKSKDINLKFTYVPEGASNILKNQFDTSLELINSKRTNKGIEITVDKYVTGIPYYGKAKIVNDTLYLDYWTNIDEMLIPSVSIPSRFKYEIVNISYKGIKFNFLGNKFQQNKK